MLVDVFGNPIGTNLAQVNGTTVDANIGNASAGTQRVVIASDQPAITVTGGGGGGMSSDIYSVNTIPQTGRDWSLDFAKLQNLDIALSALATALESITVQNGAAAAAVNIQDGGNSITVDGTFFQATQPVSGTFFQATQPVSGTVAATQSGTWTVQPGNTANSTAWLVTGTGGTFPVTGTFWQATQPVSGPLTDTQLRAVAVPVSGTFFQATQPVSGTFWQATQPVSGPLTDTQLRASAVPISLDAAALAALELIGVKGADGSAIASNANPVPVSDGGGSITVDGTFWQTTQPVSGPLTDTQLRATPVPVSGTVTATTGGLTDTQLRASAVPVSLASVPSHAVTNAGTFAVQDTRAPASAAALSNVANSASNVTLLASNANRKKATFFNDDTLSTGATLYLKFGATASATSFTVALVAQAYYEMPDPIYTGIIDGIASAGTGNCRVTELT